MRPFNSVVQSIQRSLYAHPSTYLCLRLPVVDLMHCSRLISLPPSLSVCGNPTKMSLSKQCQCLVRFDHIATTSGIDSHQRTMPILLPLTDIYGQIYFSNYKAILRPGGLVALNSHSEGWSLFVVCPLDGRASFVRPPFDSGCICPPKITAPVPSRSDFWHAININGFYTCSTRH